MRVLITGGGGNLGRVLAPALEEAGYEPILMDNRDLETVHQVVRGFRAPQQSTSSELPLDRYKSCRN
jgi:nucleoside-diphosphate-sugar epimerase